MRQMMCGAWQRSFTLGVTIVAGCLALSAQDRVRAEMPGENAVIAPGQDIHPERVIVRYKPKLDEAIIQAAHLAAGVQQVLHRYRAVPDLVLVKVPAGTVARAIRALQDSGAVQYAEPDRIVRLNNTPNDPQFNELWGLHNTGQTINGSDTGTADIDINAPEAWDIWTGGAGFAVAVMDTGIDYNHQDLAANMWTNPDEIPSNNIDDDGNGYVDDVRGYDFVNSDNEPLDDHGHGTHVAGTIGASGHNGVGVAGVNWNCKLVAIKCFASSGIAFESDILQGFEYLVANATRIRLSNHSWGGYDLVQSTYDMISALRDSGHLVVAAAGNDNNNNDDRPMYPASFDLANIIAVANVDNNGNRWFNSNYGATTVDLGAPGRNILSCSPNNGYVYNTGTSMAAPHVTGAAALIWSRDASMTYAQVRSRLLDNVRPLASMSGITVTGGMLNAFLAIDGDCNTNNVPDITERTPLPGRLIRLDGNDDRIRVAGFGSVMPTTEVTIEFWQRAHTQNTRTTFNMTTDANTNRVLAHVPWVDGMVYWDFGNILGNGRLSYTPPVSIIGSWNHFAFVASQSGNYMRIIRNGVLEASRVGMTPYVLGAPDLYIGGAGAALRFDGEIDEFRVWNVARTPVQVASNMHRRLTGVESGLIGLWRLDEGAGGATADEAPAGGAHPGTLEGGAEWALGDADCNTNNQADNCDIDLGAADCNANAIPDICEGGVQISNSLPAIMGFQDIGSGTPLNLSDDGVATVAIPFETSVFPGHDWRVTNNGALYASSSGGSFTNGPIPTTEFGGGRAAFVYWDDLDSERGNVYHGVVGTTPNRTFIVQWHDRVHYPGSGAGNGATFQIQVYESPVNGIYAQYVYIDLDFGDSNLNHAASATIGYQHSSTDGLQYSFNQAGFATDGTVISVMLGADCNDNSVPDLCELTGQDCNTNGVLDACDVANGAADCNANSIPDICDIRPHATVVNTVSPLHGYRDISGVGTPLNLSDDQVVDVTMPFTNSFFTSSALRVSNNGAMGINTPGAGLGFSNEAIPATGAFNGGQTLFVYWDDLFPAAGGNVYVATLGTAPHRTFIVEWHDIQHFSSSPGRVRFEVQIFETPLAGGPVAQYLYDDVTFGTGDDNGASASVGYQLNGTRGFQYAMNQGGTITDGLVLSVMPLDCNNNNLLDACEPSGPIHVPAEFATIQAAINASSACRNLVLVAPGTYPETINFGGRAVIVRSTGGPGVTTILGTNANAVVQGVFTSEGPGTVLDGFRITGGGGFPNGPDRLGGAIVLANSSPRFVNCIINGNTATFGGAAFLQASASSFTDCVFTGNLAQNSSVVYSTSNSNVTYTNCAFASNTSVQPIAVMFMHISTTVLTNCVFHGNTGGGNVVVVNLAPAELIARNVTISEHTAIPLRVVSARLDLSNSIVWGNVLPSVLTTGNSNVTVSYSDIQGGHPGTGNLDLPPQFVDAATGDLRLTPFSPCIDAGDNGAVPPDRFDLDDDLDTLEATPVDITGQVRFRDNLAGCNRGSGSGPLVDMGAIEFQGQTPRLGDLNCNGSIGTTDQPPFVLALIDPDAYAAGFPSCHISRGDMNCDGTVDADDIAQWVECLLAGSCP